MGADAVGVAEGNIDVPKSRGASPMTRHVGPTGVEEQGTCTRVLQEPGRSWSPPCVMFRLEGTG